MGGEKSISHANDDLDNAISDEELAEVAEEMNAALDHFDDAAEDHVFEGDTSDAKAGLPETVKKLLEERFRAVYKGVRATDESMWLV